MFLARRVFQVANSPLLLKLLQLLRSIVSSEVADVPLTNTKGETLASILGAGASMPLDQQIARITAVAKSAPKLPIDVASCAPKPK
jgi:hypothetical protein